MLFPAQGQLDHFAYEFDNWSPSGKRFAKTVPIGAPTRFMAVMADPVVVAELRDTDFPCHVGKTLGQALHQTNAYIVTSCRLRHPCAENRSEGIRRLVHPVVVNFNLGQPRQDRYCTRESLRIPGQSLQRPQQTRSAWTAAKNPCRSRPQESKRRRIVRLEMAFKDRQKLLRHSFRVRREVAVVRFKDPRSQWRFQ